MSNEENPQGRRRDQRHGHQHGPQQGYPAEHGGWQPTPQGDYDYEATAFVHIPPEDMPGASPLEAPGHGYVPPMILPLTPAADPQVPEVWQTPQQAPEAAQHQQAPQAQQHGRHGGPEHGWPEPAPGPEQPRTDPHATSEWSFTQAAPQAPQAPEAPQAPAPQQQSGPPAADVTGQWTIPVARGDLPEETGEFTASMLQAQWNAAPATLPGGATAPWAAEPPATLPGGAPAPWAAEQLPPAEPEAPAPATHAPAPHTPGADAPRPPQEPVTATHAPTPHEPVTPEPEAQSAEPEPEPEPAQEPEPESEPDVATPADPAPEPDPEPAPEAAPEAEPAAPGPLSAAAQEHPPTSYVLRVNGVDRPVTEAWIGESLLYVLRERLGLAGAKDGCSQGECGACNVQVDGRLVASCLVPAATTAGSEVRTVEGLATDGEPSDVQRALAACGAVQCGFCIPGMAMTVHDLLEGNHRPSELETRQALCGNLCRCSGYRGVLDAVRDVVEGREASAAAAAEAADAPQSPDARIPHQAPPGAGSVQPHPHDGGMA
ncbi:hypothetical protein GCM10010387_52730 [Streptomyces inusitatus]|uniref:2Fe-2S ferredoxin-type domain-containing protein n=1 Tax=Streptomyces inusitatus TaxID=68221 RepID=A0A918QIC2_9ACTN|nr:(2Fe-2S)-binding protein [Streptomyces inusitatus]GGZ51932.1 hypothetical protein GCM10010387_52730 [Streptomyces inusitatus]